jgi:hypothetical protein
VLPLYPCMQVVAHMLTIQTWCLIGLSCNPLMQATHATHSSNLSIKLGPHNPASVPSPLAACEGACTSNTSHDQHPRDQRPHIVNVCASEISMRNVQTSLHCVPDKLLGLLQSSNNRPARDNSCGPWLTKRHATPKIGVAFTHSSAGTSEKPSLTQRAFNSTGGNLPAMSLT